MSTLKLTIKKKWFDMIASGEKKEEYREVKNHWVKIIKPVMIHEGSWVGDSYLQTKHFDFVELRNGYSKNAPTLLVECKGIEIGPAKPEWSGNWQGDVFRIKLGNIIKKPE